MKSKSHTASESRHLARVARVPCVLCTLMGLGDSPALVHHMKLGTGAADRADHFLTIAVCEPHHVGPEGIHQLKERGLRLRYNVSEIDLLAMTYRAIEEMRA